MDDERFSEVGKLAPKSKADYAFVLDIVHKLDVTGIAAIVLPHGVLFRGAAEGVIRRFLIEDKNCIDAVIGLPANIFYGTSIPTCILVIKKCRKEDDNILFIDASKDFEKLKNKNSLSDEQIEQDCTDVPRDVRKLRNTVIVPHCKRLWLMILILTYRDT